METVGFRAYATGSLPATWQTVLNPSDQIQVQTAVSNVTWIPHTQPTNDPSAVAYNTNYLGAPYIFVSFSFRRQDTAYINAHGLGLYRSEGNDVNARDYAIIFSNSPNGTSWWTPYAYQPGGVIAGPNISMTMTANVWYRFGLEVFGGVANFYSNTTSGTLDGVLNDNALALTYSTAIPTPPAQQYKPGIALGFRAVSAADFTSFADIRALSFEPPPPPWGGGLPGFPTFSPYRTYKSVRDIVFAANNLDLKP